MSFNPDPSKQAQEVTFGKKTKKEYHPSLELELLQYYACLAITGAIRATSREKLYEELGLESLQLSLWFRKLSCFYKLFNSEYPHYLFKVIPSRSSSYVTGNINNIPLLKTRHTFLKIPFFPWTTIEWNKTVRLPYLVYLKFKPHVA